MGIVNYEADEIELGTMSQVPFCESMEAKRLAIIEMQKGLAPVDNAVVLDYLEHCPEFRLSELFSDEELESIREDVEVDLLVLKIILH